MSPPQVNKIAWNGTLSLGALLLIAGCALFPPDDVCSQHERQTRDNKITTEYVLQQPGAGRPNPATRPLPKNLVAQVALYKMTFDTDRAQPCTDLSIRKELVLRRLDKAVLAFKEVREFYSPDGKLIATNTEDLSAQFVKSGSYRAITPLPIPRSAPPGRYRIVSKFLLETKGSKRPTLLARVDGSFRIVPRN
jgi:hypothetical protein